MKKYSTLDQLPGRTISAVVAAEHGDRNPPNQLFLLFTDGTSLEIWGDELRPAGGLDQADVDEVIGFVKRCGAEVVHVSRPGEAC